MHRSVGSSRKTPTERLAGFIAVCGVTGTEEVVGITRFIAQTFFRQPPPSPSVVSPQVDDYLKSSNSQIVGPTVDSSTFNRTRWAVTGPKPFDHDSPIVVPAQNVFHSAPSSH